jgi:hypothetical protein
MRDDARVVVARIPRTVQREDPADHHQGRERGGRDERGTPADAFGREPFRWFPTFRIAIEAALGERPRCGLALLVVDLGIVETRGALRPRMGARVLQIAVAYPLVRPTRQVRERAHDLGRTHRRE